MAEGLAVVTSVIAVLQISNAVLSVCYDYSAAAKGASWELPKLITEVEGIRNVLQNLEPLARRAELADPAAGTKLPALALLCKPNGVLQSCFDDLRHLEEKIKPPGWSEGFGPKRKALVQACRWPFKEAQTKELLERIARFRGSLALAINTDQT